MSDLIRIATRKSPLALWQAEYVKAGLQRLHPGLIVELCPMTTRGDRILDQALSRIGGKGLFIKELEHAMLAGTADIAVHSMKDVPMAFPPGLQLGAICVRENPHDALVSNQFGSVDELPQGARLGTSSLRRASQLRHYRPDLTVLDCRGNVNTRLAKLDSGEYDAIVLAAAGLKRLQMDERIAQLIEPELSLPAPGQGAVGIEVRSDDSATQALLAGLGDQDTEARVRAERALNAALEGGCQVPIAAFAELSNATLHLRGRVASTDGVTLLRAQGRANVADAEALGRQVAADLIAQGAAELLAAVHRDD